MLFFPSLASFTQPGWTQTRTARVGVLALSEATVKLPQMMVFLPTLAQHGWVEGKNLIVEYRYARGEDLTYTESVDELIRLKVDVIYCFAAPGCRAAFAATRTIPIVMQDYTNDPLALGYAASYSHPGKNVTGVFLDAPEFAGKWVETLRAMVPGIKQIAILWDPKPGRVHLDAVKRAAESLRLRVQVQEVITPKDFEKAFLAIRGKSQAVIITPSPMAYTYAKQLADLANKYKLPATSMAKQFAEMGGTVSYGPNNTESTLRNTEQVAKILNGQKPGDIPIERPYKFDFLINMKSVKALKLKVPDYLLVGAELVD
ncbi:MAG: ABC transporter substrate-binding protein [Burkholderiales bacterium]